MGNEIFIQNLILFLPHTPYIHFYKFLNSKGCANGRIEIWDVITGQNKCVHDDAKGIGITHLKLCGFKLVIVRLSGHLEFLELKTIQNQYHNSAPSPNSLSGPTRRCK